MSDKRQFDALVIGSGIAGLFYALRVAEQGSVAIVTKKRAADSATNWAQGGIAAVSAEEDSFEAHARDTLAAGAGLCRRAVVERVVERGPAMIALEMRARPRGRTPLWPQTWMEMAIWISSPRILLATT